MKKQIILSLLSFIFVIAGCNKKPPSEPLVTSPDLEPPRVSFANLEAGYEVGGRLKVLIEATDNLGILKVEVVCNNTSFFADKIDKNLYETFIDTSLFENGVHTLKAQATDLYKNVGDSTLSIKFNNSFSLLSPNDKQRFSGSVFFQAIVKDLEAGDSVEFWTEDNTKRSDATLNVESGLYEGSWGNPNNGEYKVKAVIVNGGSKKAETPLATITVEKTVGFSEVGGFGSNPGNLRMWLYAPSNIVSKPGLVIALHGCSQNAASYAYDTEWNNRAITAGKFYVVYPEQKSSNNSQLCFTWFTKTFQQRNYKENASIAQMIDYMVASYDVDPNKVYITGFSAGACMSSVMLATYPEKFAGASLIAGIGYGEAVDVASAGLLMKNGKGTNSPEDWGNLFKTGYPAYSGSYNHKILIFQGNLDAIVVPQNAEDLEEAWGNLKGLYSSQTGYNNFIPTGCGSGDDYICKKFENNLYSYSMTKLGHALPTNNALISSNYAAYATISSTTKAAEFWGF